jgi:thiol-disulfide isomerase/thioredoxin
VVIAAGSVRAAPLPLTSLAGDPVLLDRKPDECALIVHFWATWCANCAEELPLLGRLAVELAHERVRLVIVAAGEDAQVVRDYLTAHALSIPVLLDARGKVWRKAGGVGLPLNLIRTAAGDRLLAGPQSEAQWAAARGSLHCRSPAAP